MGALIRTTLAVGLLIATAAAAQGDAVTTYKQALEAADARCGTMAAMFGLTDLQRAAHAKLHGAVAPIVATTKDETAKMHQCRDTAKQDGLKAYRQFVASMQDKQVKADARALLVNWFAYEDVATGQPDFDRETRQWADYRSALAAFEIDSASL